MLQITINGEPQQVDDGLSIQNFLAQVQRDGGSNGIAIAVNGEILHHEQYAQRRIKQGDSLEIVQMTAGG